jgi:NAD(P)-dependent dehydrogenase (short-subunit alcohol dehydrogenase family)
MQSTTNHPMNPSKRFAGRSVLITGSTSGIGAHLAAAFATEGAHVIVSGRSEANGHAVVAGIAAAGGRADLVPADLARGGIANRALQLADGRIDVLINNAGRLIAPSPSTDVAESLIDEAFAVTVKAVFMLTAIIAPVMAAGGGGAIVNMGSINGQLGMANSALYSATKATVHSLTKSFAAEYGPLGVRVNTVAPGPTLTAKVEALADYLAPMIAQFPSRRASTMAEVAAAVLFLASDAAANIHGATLAVDGGRMAV